MVAWVVQLVADDSLGDLEVAVFVLETEAVVPSFVAAIAAFHYASRRAGETFVVERFAVSPWQIVEDAHSDELPLFDLLVQTFSPLLPHPLLAHDRAPPRCN
jgi:hypothetical protein